MGQPAPNFSLPDTAGQTVRLADLRGRYVVPLAYAGGIDSIASARTADIAQATNHVKAALADIAAKRPIAQPVTRPYGCSIKYQA